MLKHTIQVQSNNAAFTNTATARDMLLNSAAVQYALHLLSKINEIVTYAQLGNCMHTALTHCRCECNASVHQSPKLTERTQQPAH